MRGGARVHDASQLPYVKTELESNTVKIFVAALKAPPSRRMGHRTLIVCSALKSKRESARRRCHTRGSYNASGGGPKKIETQTRISQKTLAHAPHFECKRSRPQQNLNPNANQQETIAHAPHSQCKRWRPQKMNPKRKSDRRRSHRAALTMQAVTAPQKSESKRNSARRRLNTRRIRN